MGLEGVAGARQFQGMVLWMVGWSMWLREGVCRAIALPPSPALPSPLAQPASSLGGARWSEMWHHVG